MLFKKWHTDGDKKARYEGLDNPYTRFLYTELILRDQLAIDRTILANERTFLAYCRTSLALVVTGAGFIKFFDTKTDYAIGWSLIGFSVLVLIIGMIRAIRVSHRIKRAGIGLGHPQGEKTECETEDSLCHDGSS